MKRPLLVLCGALCLSVACPVSVRSASTDLRFWHRHHKDASKAKDAAKTKDASKAAATNPKPKAKHSLLHREKPSREQSAHTETAYGMTGPKSVGWRHPQPGPAGVGAK